MGKGQLFMTHFTVSDVILYSFSLYTVRVVIKILVFNSYCSTSVYVHTCTCSMLVNRKSIHCQHKCILLIAMLELRIEYCMLCSL